MELAVIGATGMVGSRVVAEALRRDHAVTAISRDPAAEYDPQPGLTLAPTNVLYLDQLVEALDGHDAVASAFRGPTDPAGEQNPYGIFMEGTRNVMLATKRTGSDPLLVVGGAASLYVEPGVQFRDLPEFPYVFAAEAPEAYYEYQMEHRGAASKEAIVEAAREMTDPERHYPENPDDTVTAARTSYHLFEHDETFDWRFLSPPAYMIPDERTGGYEVGGEELPTGEDGRRLGIATEDVAVAIVDELEDPDHRWEHYTVYDPDFV